MPHASGYGTMNGETSGLVRECERKFSDDVLTGEETQERKRMQETCLRHLKDLFVLSSSGTTAVKLLRIALALIVIPAGLGDLARV